MRGELTAPVLSVSRHRIVIDGNGVTTLIVFHTCPLRCRYCINPECNDPAAEVGMYTPIRLLNEVRRDNLYFLATGGGITFGGGEPLLRSEFIAEFCRIAPPEWTITLETSLNVAWEHVERVLPYVDCYIVDVKDMNPDIYRRYTGGDGAVMTSNLRHMLSREGMADRVRVVLPWIDGFNDDTDRDRSERQLRAMGVKSIERFDYITDLSIFE